MIDHSENQYALDKNDNLVSVFDVPTGEACECKCTKCNEPVAAKNKGKTRNTELKPNQRAAHFYHIVSKNCQGETLVHILAKDVINESKRLVLEVPIYEQNILKDIKNQEVLFDSIQLEKRLDIGDTFIIPDVTAKVKDKILYIEIVYQNSVSEYKRNLIINNELSFLAINFNDNEINWNDFKLKNELKEKIRWFLFEKTLKNQKWIYNSKYPEMVDSATEKTRYTASRIETLESDNAIEHEVDESNYEPSLEIRLLLDPDETERRLEIIGEVLNYSETWFIRDILRWEEQYLYFMKDENFETTNSKLVIKEHIKYELLNLQSINIAEWIDEYDRMKRRRFY